MAKEKLHPKYYPDAKVTCTCGNTYTVGSTQPELEIEICSQCHPFFTGKEVLIDTEGRVEKFEKKRKAAKPTKQKGKKKAAETKEEKPKRLLTLKELLEEKS